MNKMDLRVEAATLAMLLILDKLELSDQILMAATKDNIKNIDLIRDDRIRAAQIIKDLIQLIDKYDDILAEYRLIFDKIKVEYKKDIAQ